jgi:tetratricopeptide (TPR) repeat protein
MQRQLPELPIRGILTRWARGWPILLLIAVLLSLMIWLLPNGASAYHLEMGGRMLERVTISGGDPSPDALTKAKAHLEAALRWQKDNARAHQLLSQVYYLAEDLREAAQALVRYIELRPDSPRGWWDLAQVYEAMAQRLQAAVDVDLMERLVEIKPQELVMGTETLRCTPGGQTSSCGRVLKEWELPLAPASQPKGLEAQLGIRRRVLATGSPLQVELTVRLPTTATTLFFWMGIDPAARWLVKDGITFGAEVDGANVFGHYLGAEEARQGWWPGQVDLGAWAGQEVSLSLGADLGTAGEEQDNWAGWGDLQLLGPEGVPYAAVAPADRLVAAWHAAGFTTQDFISGGEEARKQGQYAKALRLYARAAEINGDWGPIWYYAGLAYKELQEWENAQRSFQHGCELAANRNSCYELGNLHSEHGSWQQALESFEKGVLAASGAVGKSNLYLEIGFIRHHHLQPADMAGAWEAYEQALLLNDFTAAGWRSPDVLRAGTHFERGLFLAAQGHWEDAVLEYQQAINLNPSGYWSHVNMAWALWMLDEKEQAKEAALVGADLRPDLENAYRLLGLFHRLEGNIEEATAMYAKVLELDPEDNEARDALRALGSSSMP